MLTMDELDRQLEGDVSPAGLLYLTVGLVVGFGLLVGALLGAILGHFVLEPQLDMAHGTSIASLLGAIVVALLCYIVLRATTAHMLSTHH